MNDSISRKRLPNWGTIKLNQSSATQIGQPQVSGTSQKRRNHIGHSNFAWALFITIVIVSTQLFIAHNYLRHPARRRAIFNSIASQEANLLTKFSWFCHSFMHLNYIAELANDLHIDLVIADPDLLSLLLGDEDEIAALRDEITFSSSGGKSNQEPSEKTIIHLAAINETSGGQPHLRKFLNLLKRHYHIIEYHDVSETMPAEIYKRRLDQLDDTHADAVKDSVGEVDLERGNVSPQDNEISKVYTEFATHIFVVNASHAKFYAKSFEDHYAGCSSGSAHSGHRGPFVVIHLFVLYNYEFQPDGYWMQSSLVLDEIERHKLLTYGVHTTDFRVPHDHYYVHRKRKISAIAEASSSMIPIKYDRPLTTIKVLDSDHIFHYVNNSYLNCKQSSFNISALLSINRKMSAYLTALDSSRPLSSTKYNKYHTEYMLEQLSLALQFMNVFSRSYGNFNFWLTGSSLLAYYKFCQPIALMPNSKYTVPRRQSTDDDDLSFWMTEDYEEQSVDENTVVELELGLFESELDSSTLKDLSEAGKIGVTLITDWRDTKRLGLVSFRIRDCPNLVFNLHFYRLTGDSYGQHYETSDNMIYNYKFRRHKTQRSISDESVADSRVSHHAFSTKNLELCWTRVDRLEPFRVPCDVHGHLFKIYVQ